MYFLVCHVNVYEKSVLIKRKQKSVLKFFKKANTNENVCLHLQSRQDKRGTKYQIIDNIERVFTKFVKDGKATISFKEPSHYLNIMADSIHLKVFLFKLHRIMNKIGRNEDAYCTDLTFHSILLDTFHSKIVVTKNSEYPVCQGFPRTTAELYINGLGRRSFDRQILMLHNLKVLNLSNNNISALPKALGTLPCLQELILSDNDLGQFLNKSARSKWEWLEQPAIKNNLLKLEMDGNFLSELPIQIGKLKNLTTLSVCYNQLTRLPQSIGNLRHLNFLHLSHNDLMYLPGIIRYLSLTVLNITENPFVGYDNCTINNIEFPSLFEWSAKKIINSRVTYDAMPNLLVKFLDEAKYCYICRNACFNSYIRKFLHLTPDMLTVMECRSMPNMNIELECYYCSKRCEKASHLFLHPSHFVI